LAILWTCLLITIAGLDQPTWFLIAIGGVGMLQNVFAAGTVRKPEASNFHLTPFAPAPTIIGRRFDCCRQFSSESICVNKECAESDKRFLEKSDPRVSAEGSTPQAASEAPSSRESPSRADSPPLWREPAGVARNCTVTPGVAGEVHAVGVHGALIELEKWVPTAGLAMVQVFFPGGLSYNDASIREKQHKDFWKAAYETATSRKKAAEKQRTDHDASRGAMLE
jgi:hypothetical protein